MFCKLLRVFFGILKTFFLIMGIIHPEDEIKSSKSRAKEELEGRY
jgi:hypothetical protein